MRNNKKRNIIIREKIIQIKLLKRFFWVALCKHVYTFRDISKKSKSLFTLGMNIPQVLPNFFLKSDHQMKELSIFIPRNCGKFAQSARVGVLRQRQVDRLEGGFQNFEDSSKFEIGPFWF